MNRLSAGAAHARRRTAQTPALLSLILAGCAAASPLAAAAADPVPEARQSVILRHVDLHPRDREGARALLRRVDEAAMEACGADDHSLREVKTAVRASQCWKHATADAVRQINDPLVSEVFENGPKSARARGAL